MTAYANQMIYDERLKNRATPEKLHGVALRLGGQNSSIPLQGDIAEMFRYAEWHKQRNILNNPARIDTLN